MVVDRLRQALVTWLVARSLFESKSEATEFLASDRAQAQPPRTNMVGLFIGLLIAGIVAIDVFIPVITDAINGSNVTGNTKTILDLLPLFASLLLLVALAAPLMRQV